MSARNYLSAREKSIAKVIDCLPNINQRKYLCSTGKDLPNVSANPVHVNRNLIFTYEVPFNNTAPRSGTPFSDLFSESETGTPDFISEESDSSSGSTLQRNNAEASKALATEWEKIERTLYDEDGEKTAKPNLIEECQQWKQTHPQLRIIGKSIKLPEKKQLSCQFPPDHDEVIAIHYSDYDEFSESDERLSLSSTDVTPQNSPRASEEHLEPKITREKAPFHFLYNIDDNLTDSFCSLLQITPVNLRSSPQKKQNSSILKSEIASSRWMKSSRGHISLNNDRNSAKSFISLDTRHLSNFGLSAAERKKVNSRVITARSRDLARLEPLCSPEVPNNDITRLALSGTPSQFSMRKVSLPPLFLEEDKLKVSSHNSAKKHNKMKKGLVKSLFHADKVMH